MINYFRQRRDELDLTQRQIAEAIGVTPAAVSSWETGVAVPRPSLWERAAAIYQDTVGHIAAAVHEISQSKHAQSAA